MALLRKIPGVSLILLLLTYGAEGWIYGSWVSRILEEGVLLAQINQQYRFSTFYGVAVAAIIFLSLFLRPPRL